ncbi:hypothetical protein L798_09724 [Zootermopsis nevadensis]|uniref:Uncharacterized protein n=1 Tax=Zootermopsis nevadensis TaxID=136037 RepID=A0A067QZ14_ZOONE|nr:hypothetical protein L798_09724 [Zootermopsis nevadensis]
MSRESFNTVSFIAIFGKVILVMKILTYQRVKRSNLGRSSVVCDIICTRGEHVTLVLISVSRATLLSYSDFLHHVEDLKPGEGARRVEVVAPCPIHTGDQLAHVSGKVVL